MGHDPWKIDEALALGAVAGMLKSGDRAVPLIAGEPYLSAPPSSGRRPPSRRLSAPGCPCTTPRGSPRASSRRSPWPACTWRPTPCTARAPGGSRCCSSSAASASLIRAHEMSTDLAGLAGVSVGVAGLALAAPAPLAGRPALRAGPRRRLPGRRAPSRAPGRHARPAAAAGRRDVAHPSLRDRRGRRARHRRSRRLRLADRALAAQPRPGRRVAGGGARDALVRRRDAGAPSPTSPISRRSCPGTPGPPCRSRRGPCGARAATWPRAWTCACRSPRACSSSSRSPSSPRRARPTRCRSSCPWSCWAWPSSIRCRAAQPAPSTGSASPPSPSWRSPSGWGSPRP
ncbi:MAG: hypothetical protein MZW92_62435 [Comamonadaceae bacterium]|nr:hypothetical protein [Comamonadaceae bacterium]